MKIVLGFIILTCTALAHASESEHERGERFFTINPEHTEISFEVSYMQLSSVRGLFQDYQGHFIQNTKEQYIKDAILKINTKSIFTGDLKRDQHLISPDFFDHQRYPNITFKQTETAFYQSESQVFQLNGSLSIKDQTHDISLDVVYLGNARDQLGRKAFFHRITGIIDRKKFNLSWNQYIDSGGFVIGDNVLLNLVVESYPTNHRSAYSRFFSPSQTRERIKAPPSPSSQVENLNSPTKKIDQLYNKVHNLKKEKELLKIKQNENNSVTIQTEKLSSKWMIYFVTYVICSILIFTLLIILIIKLKFKTAITNLNGPIFSDQTTEIMLSNRGIFLAELFMDIGIIYTLYLFIALSLLWLGLI